MMHHYAILSLQVMQAALVLVVCDSLTVSRYPVHISQCPVFMGCRLAVLGFSSAS